MSDSNEKGMEYWLRWQTPACALFIIGPAIVASLAIKHAKAEPLYFNDLWRPRWRYLNPLWLLFYRVVAFICLCPMLYEIVALDGAFAFYFYTQWTFTLVMLYFALATATSAYGCWMSSIQASSENEAAAEFLKRDVEEIWAAPFQTYRDKEIRGTIKLPSHHAGEQTRERAGFWGYFMQTVYQTCAGAVILTDLVFWCILVPFGTDITHLYLNMLMGCMHSLNAVFLLIDTTLNDLQFPWFRIAYFVQWSCLYVVFQWVLHTCGFTWWPYPFLELDNPWAPLWYFALAVVHIPCYGLYAMIVRAKNSILAKIQPRARSY